MEFVTTSENILHSCKFGLAPKGEESPKAKLSVKEVMFIRNNYIPYHKEFGTIPLSKKFGVNPATISKIIKYQTWKEII